MVTTGPKVLREIQDDRVKVDDQVKRVFVVHPVHEVEMVLQVLRVLQVQPATRKSSPLP